MCLTIRQCLQLTSVTAAVPFFITELRLDNTGISCKDSGSAAGGKPVGAGVVETDEDFDEL